jgi:uncharacterized short protein YbdD (DUF466 family)
VTSRLPRARGRTLERVHARIVSLARALRRVAGVPDYDAYVAHMRERHPGTPIMERAAFARERLAHRYDRPGSRCC